MFLVQGVQQRAGAGFFFSSPWPPAQPRRHLKVTQTFFSSSSSRSSPCPATLSKAQYLTSLGLIQLVWGAWSQPRAELGAAKPSLGLASPPAQPDPEFSCPEPKDTPLDTGIHPQTLCATAPAASEGRIYSQFPSKANLCQFEAIPLILALHVPIKSHQISSHLFFFQALEGHSWVTPNPSLLQN